MESLQTWLAGERGRQLALAAALGIRPSAVSQWTRVPAERVIDVERVTGIPRHDLRPDIYPAPPGETAACGSGGTVGAVPPAAAGASDGLEKAGA